MLSTCKDAQRINSQVIADNYTLETVKEFVYLGTTVTTKNDVSLEIKQIKQGLLLSTDITMVSMGN